MEQEKTLTQAEVNELIGKVRKEARDRARKEFETELEASKKLADQEKLKENQEYKELSEQLKEQVGNLEPLQAQVDRYLEIMQGVLKYEMEGLSDEAKQAIDGLPGDVTSKLEWLQANKQLFVVEQGDGVGSPSHKGKKKTTTPTSRFRMKGI